jgi:hypothetical protein
MIDLIEDADESATNIYKNLMAAIKKSGLHSEGLTSIGADNANVNFGNNHSVYSLFHDQNCNLIKGELTEWINISLSHFIFESLRKLLLPYTS